MNGMVSEMVSEMGLLDEELVSVVSQLVESFGLPPLSDCSWVEPGAHLVGFRWAVLGFEGAGVAGVAVGLSPEAVSRVTEAMTGVGREEQDDELMQDIVGELANILGGNLQPLLPGTTGLQLPSRAAPAGLPVGPTLRCAAHGDAAPSLAVRLLPRAPEA